MYTIIGVTYRAPPTTEDEDYVQKYLYEFANIKAMPESRHFAMGLLDQSPASRRALAKYYAVPEPNLLRCLMRDHFEFYRNQHDSIITEGDR